MQAFDSVRGMFIEGDRLYENSGFYRKTHIQVCVRNPLCIKGVFQALFSQKWAHLHEDYKDLPDAQYPGFAGGALGITA